MRGLATIELLITAFRTCYSKTMSPKAGTISLVNSSKVTFVEAVEINPAITVENDAYQGLAEAPCARFRAFELPPIGKSFQTVKTSSAKVFLMETLDR